MCGEVLQMHAEPHVVVPLLHARYKYYKPFFLNPVAGTHERLDGAICGDAVGVHVG